MKATENQITQERKATYNVGKVLGTIGFLLFLCGFLPALGLMTSGHDEVRPWDWTSTIVNNWPSRERPPMPKRRRRSFTPQFKAQVVLEVLTGVTSQAEVVRRNGLKPELVARWKAIALDRLETLFQGEAQSGQDQARVAELERMVGRLTMELEIAKKASALLPSVLSRGGRSS